jgi:hypothetical protein
MSLSEEAFHAFANDLVSRSENHTMAWEPFSDGDGFAFVGTKAAVVIRSRDADGNSPYVLELFDESDGLREQLQSGYEFDASGNYEMPHEWNETLARLYHLARRAALRLDELSTSILEDIDAGRSGDRPQPPGVELPSVGSPPTPRTRPPVDDSDLDDLPF